jgi:hypothetical protein
MLMPRDATRPILGPRRTILLRNEQEHFLACVRDRSRPPALDLSDALTGLKLAGAAIESLSVNREVILAA